MNERVLPYRRAGRLKADTVNLSHGGGGKAMRDLIDDVFVAAFERWIAAGAASPAPGTTSY